MASMSIKMGTRQYCVLTTTDCQTTVVERKAVFKSQRIGGRKRRNFMTLRTTKRQFTNQMIVLRPLIKRENRPFLTRLAIATVSPNWLQSHSLKRSISSILCRPSLFFPTCSGHKNGHRVRPVGYEFQTILQLSGVQRNFDFRGIDSTA